MSIIIRTAADAGKEIPQLSARYTPEIKKITGYLNKLALRETRGDRLSYTFSKATPEDLKRLTSLKIEDSYKRATWVNPKDNKVYHILEEGRDNDKVRVRILDKDGAFVKNAELEPQNIVIFDNFFSPRGFTHGEMMETLLKRFNPFANIERLEHKKGLIENIRYRGRLPMHLELKRFKELEQKMADGKRVDFISVSETNLVDASKVINRNGRTQQEYVAQNGVLTEFKPLFKSIMLKGARIFEAAGNENYFANIGVSDRLAIDGVEGVGSLRKGKISPDSCSRHSVFTQHYERRDFRSRLVLDENGKSLGINITGLPGTDIPLNWKTKKLLNRNLGGTSYATPVRVAKISLNKMMEQAGL